MEKSSKIYVAGHTGLIGSAMLRRLQADGFTNLITRTHQELELADTAAVEKFFATEKPEYVILSAGKVGGIIENTSFPADFINANLAIQLNVLRAAHAHGVKKLILFASSCMYPRECPQPMSEDALYSGKPEPTSMAYAVAKMAGVQMCLAYNKQYGEQRFIPVIPNSVYGPNDNFNPQGGHVMSALIRRFDEARETKAENIELWGTGKACREFIYADDVAEACLLLLSTDQELPHLPLNIGSGTDLSIRELAEKIAKTIGYTGTISQDTTKPDGAPRKLLDSSRIKSLGFAPKIDLESGLKATYAWYRENVKTVRI